MMNFKQNMTVLFWLYRQKVKADGKAPIYARITIDGKYTEISTGKKVNPASWDLEGKLMTGTGMEEKLTNQKLAQLQTDVERIFNGLQTQFPSVTPAMVKNVYSGKPEKIHQKQFSVERIAEVRDAFIFQCFTGFAYQDIYELSPENIVLVGRKKERWLIKHRGKTEVGEMVPILPIVDELIAKYKSHPYCVANRKLIPVNSNHRYNVYLKEIADICEIRDITGKIRRLDTHDARHFFADMMLNNGVPLETSARCLVIEVSGRRCVIAG